MTQVPLRTGTGAEHLRAVDVVVEAERRLPLPVDGCGSFSRSSYLWVLLWAPMSDLRSIGLVRDNLASKQKTRRMKKSKGEKKKEMEKKSSYGNELTQIIPVHPVLYLVFMVCCSAP